MKAMILAAGRGERMRPLTDHCPKPLLSVAGKSLIEYHIAALVRAGVSQIVINIAWLGAKIKQQLGDGQHYGVEILYSDEGDQALETAGGIINALPLLGQEPFILVNGDIWTDYNFSQLPSTLTNKLAHLVLVENPEHHPQGDFDLDQAGLVLDQPAYTYSGIAVYSPALFTNLKQGVRPLSPLLRLAMQQQQVSGECYTGDWWDVGTPQRLTELEAFITKKQ